MSAFNAAWFTVLKGGGPHTQPRRGKIVAGSSVPAEERRRMARTGQINPEMGVFPRSRDRYPSQNHPSKKPTDMDPMIGDETNPMESPVMRTTEQIGEMEREAEEDMFKSSPFDAAWSMLKEDEKFKPEPSRQMQLDGSQPKGHPSTTYGMKTPAMTRKPTASLRTGAVPARASQEDIEEFMRINSAKEDEENAPMGDVDRTRLRAEESRFSSPYKSNLRFADAEEMHGENITDIFQQQGIPVTSSVKRDVDRNIRY